MAKRPSAPVRAATEPPSKKSNPALLYGGIAGGALLLILLVALVSSGGQEPEERRAVQPKKVETPPPSPAPRPVKPDTGGIVFVCANSPKHEDKEVLVTDCPCGAKRKFYVDREGGGYRCLKCGRIFDNAKIRCGECGRVAVKTHLKPNFD